MQQYELSADDVEIFIVVFTTSSVSAKTIIRVEEDIRDVFATTSGIKREW
jgi:hypothetical protein